MSKGNRYNGSKSCRKQGKAQNKSKRFATERGMANETSAGNSCPAQEQAYDESDCSSLDEQPWYVLDLSTILSCVDILYEKDEKWQPPLNFRPNLEEAHLIIPEIVFEELNRLKDSRTVARIAARIALRRLGKIISNSSRTLDEIMTLACPVPTGLKKQMISILPLHRSFSNSLPWVPENDDKDGWTVVTALAATMLRKETPVDGSIPRSKMLAWQNTCENVTLLTNNASLLSLADSFNVKVTPYSFDRRPVFTGIRNLVVPTILFRRFWQTGILTEQEFRKYLPNESPLEANEYVVMTPENGNYPEDYFIAASSYSNVARYHKGKQRLLQLSNVEKERVVPPNTGIATYYDAMNDDSISVIVATGKAGTGKTYQIVSHAIRAINDNKFARVILIIDSENGVGILPGGQDQKLVPVVAFCKDAIRSYLAGTSAFRRKWEMLQNRCNSDQTSSSEETKNSTSKEPPKANKGSKKDRRAKRLKRRTMPNNRTYDELLNEQADNYYQQYFTAIPYVQAQGRNLENAIIIVDEAQRILIDEMTTFITRPGKNSLLVVCGDVDQIKNNSPEKRLKNGLTFASEIYRDWEGCAHIHLTENMRGKASAVVNRNYERVIREICELEI